MNNSIYEKIEILMIQNKYSEAISMLNNILKESPSDIKSLTLLSEILLQQDKYDDAESIITNAIAQAPDNDMLYYIYARINIQKDDYTNATKQITTAIEMNPVDADYFALYASILLTKKEYQKALELANRALELDAENILGLNMRSSALLKLDRKEESFETIYGALNEDPNNSFTHANYGWNLLEKGEHKKALEHFKESLKNNPNNDYAQSGMVESIKATNVFYRQFLRYSFWMSNMQKKNQWFVIIGFYVAFKLLRFVANNNSSLRPFLIPVIVVFGLIMFSTWVMKPISNLFLRLHPFGNLLLDNKEKQSATYVGLSLLTAIIGGILYLVFQQENYISVIVFGLTMMIPLGVLYASSKNKLFFPAYALGMIFCGITAIFLTFLNNELFNVFTIIYLVAFMLFQWVANYMIIEENNY